MCNGRPNRGPAQHPLFGLARGSEWTPLRRLSTSAWPCTTVPPRPTRTEPHRAALSLTPAPKPNESNRTGPEASSDENGRQGGLETAHDYARGFKYTLSTHTPLTDAKMADRRRPGRRHISSDVTDRPRGPTAHTYNRRHTSRARRPSRPLTSPRGACVLSTHCPRPRARCTRCRCPRGASTSA